jgi:hypothetical protein
VRSQGQWICDILNTDGCTGCHHMGDKATGEIPQSLLSKTANSKAAWDLRKGAECRRHTLGLGRSESLSA